jgi:RNA polymerase sigma factor (TIGR02999 family)
VKRGAGTQVLPLADTDATTAQPLDDLIALSQALNRLEQLGARQAQVVECRFFGGLSLDETAEALNTSAATVSRDWTFARAWLHHELATAAAPARDHSSNV